MSLLLLYKLGGSSAPVMPATRSVTITGQQPAVSNGDPLWTPAALGAADRLRYDWTDTASMTLGTGGSVNAVPNKGTIGSAANLTAVVQNSLPAPGTNKVSFNGSTILASSPVTFDTCFTDLTKGIWYGIVAFNSGVVWFKWQATGVSRIGLEGSNRSDWPDSSSQLIGWSDTVTTTPKILTIQRDGANHSAYLNGNLVATAARTNALNTDAAWISFGGDYAAASTPTQTNLASADYTFQSGLIDDGTSTTRQKVEGWLAWSMSALGDTSFVTALPSGHPYKSSAPTTPATGITLSPSSGSISLAGQAPALTTQTNPATRSVTLAGQTPVLNTALAPATGSITLTGQTPTVTIQVTTFVNPATGAITLAGESPALTTALNAATGSVALAGQTSPLTTFLSPATGAISLAGQSALVGLRVNPASGSIALAGQAAALTGALNPASGSVALTGQSPALTTALSPATGAVTLTGQQPTLSLGSGIFPATANIAISGAAPALTTALTPATGSISLAGQTPVLTTALNPAVGAVTVTGQTPTVTSSSSNTLNPATGAITLSGQTPAVSNGSDDGTSWDAANSSSAYTLSALNRTATKSSADGDQMTRSLDSFSGKKVYAELLVSNDFLWIGVGNASYSIAAAPGNTGGLNDSIGFYWGDNVRYGGSTIISGVGNNPVPSRLPIAIDAVNMRFWAKMSNGLWNNSGTADPATNVGGIDISAMGTGPLYLIGGAYYGSSVFTIKAATAEWTGTAPTGFVAINAAAGNQTVSPATGSIALAGLSPALTTQATPTTGAITLTGQTPTIQVAQTLFPASGAISVSGQPATLSTVTRPASGAISLAGQSPALTTATTPATGVVTIAGQTPTVTISSGNTLSPATGSVVISGQTPVLVTVLGPAAGAVAIVGQSPQLTTTLAPATRALTITGQTPSVLAGNILSPQAGLISILGQTPKVSGQRSLARSVQRIRRIA